MFFTQYFHIDISYVYLPYNIIAFYLILVYFKHK